MLHNHVINNEMVNIIEIINIDFAVIIITITNIINIIIIITN